MIKDRTFTAFITRARVGSKNITFGSQRASELREAIEAKTIDKVVVVLVEDNSEVIEEIPSLYFNDFIWHNIKGSPAIDMSRVRQKMGATQ